MSQEFLLAYAGRKDASNRAHAAHVAKAVDALFNLGDATDSSTGQGASDYTMLRQSKEPTYLRLEMVRYAKEFGIKPCARQFSTTVKTVRKWLRRWQPGSLSGLQDHSRAPLHPRQGITRRQRKLDAKLLWGYDLIPHP